LLAAGLLALGLAAYGEELGWPAPWRELVLRLRRQENPDVRLAALNLSISPDPEPAPALRWLVP